MPGHPYLTYTKGQIDRYKFANQNTNLQKISTDNSEPHFYELQLSFFNLFMLVIIWEWKCDIYFKFQYNLEKTNHKIVQEKLY